jgi:predicted GIY-YIG superfamily endonuclease
MKRQIRSIYIIKNGEGLCKIGISNDPERRLKGLFAGSGSSLCIVYTHEVESNIAFPCGARERIESLVRIGSTGNGST